MLQEQNGTASRVFAQYKLINKSFQESSEEVKKAITSVVNQSANVELIIADGLYGLGKETWDKEEDRWGVKEYNELFAFCKVRIIESSLY